LENVDLISDQRVVKALSHPLRSKLLVALDGREVSPSQLAQELGEALGTVSYHVRALQDTGLLRLVRTEQRRGAVEHYYTAVEWSVAKDTWASVPAPLKRAVATSGISQIGEDVSAAVASSGFDKPHSSHLSRSILELDEKGAAQLAEEVSRLMEKASTIEAESRERSRSSADQPVSYGLALMMFEVADGRK